MMTIEEFASRAVGVPFETRGRTYAGVDCWGLVVLAYRDVFGIVLPSYAELYTSPLPGAHLHAVMERERSAARWQSVQQPHAGDVILMRVFGRSTHCGVIVRRGQMLHVQKGADTCLDSYTGLIWKDRVEGFWRHPDRRE